MSVVLLILKILGILLLVLLGILLYLFFFPVWLRARGGYTGEPFLHAKVLGFLSFWQVDVDIRGKARDISVTAFWGKLKLYPRPAKKAEGKDQPAAETAGTKPTASAKTDTAAAVAAKPEATAKPASTGTSPDTANSNAADMTADAGKTEPQAAEGAAENGSSGGPDLSKVMDLVKDPATYRAIGTVLKWIFYIPKKMRFHLGGTNMRFALSDPNVTGMLSAVLLQMPAYYEPDVILEPDFTSEDPYMDGVVCLNAHLSIAMILYAVIRILLDRDCRGLIKAGLALVKN